MEKASIIGVDLAKHVFQVHGARSDGSVAFRKRISRAKLLLFLSSQPKCIVAWRHVPAPTLGRATF
jgi:transposase